MNDNKPQTQKIQAHYFSLEFAAQHGVKEAIVLKFLAHKVRLSKNVRNDKKWFFNPIREVTKRYPYIPKSTMDKLLKRLKADDLVEIGNYNRRGYDRTGWYTVPQEVMDAVEKGKLIRVGVKIAAELGIAAGVLIENLRYWIKRKAAKRKKGDASTVYHKMSPAGLAMDLPCFDQSTIKRALKALAETPVPRIVKHPTLKATYTLPEMVQDGGAGRDKAGSNRDTGGAERDNTGAKRDEEGSKRDNNTHCKPLSNAIGNSVETPFKEETPASPAVVGDRSDDRNQEAITYEKLKDINKNNSHVFEFKNPKLGPRDQPAGDPGMVAVSLVVKLSWSFIGSLSDDTLYNLQNVTDMDQLVAEVNALFLPHFDSDAEELAVARSIGPAIFKEVFFPASLEFVVNAIASQHADSFTHYFHSIENLSGCIFTNLKQHIFERLDADNTRSWQRWMEDRKKQFASVDEHKEFDASLAPAEKARVLRNALESRRQIGYLDQLCRHKEMPIIFSNADLDKAERLFELNREFCVGQLLYVIDRCVYSRIHDVTPEGFDERFHVRRGHKLGYFLKHTIKIAEELEVTDLNGWQPLAEDLKHNEDEDETTELATG